MIASEMRGLQVFRVNKWSQTLLAVASLARSSCFGKRLSMAASGSTVKVLYLNCSGRDEQSFTNIASRAFFEKYLNLHPDHVVDEVDLWDETLLHYNLTHAAAKMRMNEGKEIPQDKLTFAPIEDMVQRLFSAHKLVISSPVWNHGVPYVLKQYIDCIVQPRLTFQEALTVEECQGLLEDRPMLLITSSAWDYTQEPTSKLDHMHPYLKDIFGLIGFTDIRHIYVKNTCNVPYQNLLNYIKESTLKEAEHF